MKNIHLGIISDYDFMNVTLEAVRRNCTILVLDTPETRKIAALSEKIVCFEDGKIFSVNLKIKNRNMAIISLIDAADALIIQGGSDITEFARIYAKRCRVPIADGKDPVTSAIEKAVRSDLFG